MFGSSPYVWGLFSSFHSRGQKWYIFPICAGLFLYRYTFKVFNSVVLYTRSYSWRAISKLTKKTVFTIYAGVIPKRVFQLHTLQRSSLYICVGVILLSHVHLPMLERLPHMCGGYSKILIKSIFSFLSSHIRGGDYS